jgi:F1F0 ATPase subunit 2
MLVRLEMDEERMSWLSFAGLPPWAMALDLLAHLTAGIALGILYFRGLWRNVRRFAGGGRAAAIIALMIGRFALLGGLLTLASLEGALPLLVMTLGVFIARAVVMRRVRQAAP